MVRLSWLGAWLGLQWQQLLLSRTLDPVAVKEFDLDCYNMDIQ